MSRSTTTHCDRCGAVILEGGTVLDVRAGSLRAALHQPVDLCGDCGPLLLDWLRGGRHQDQGSLGDALADTLVATGLVGGPPCSA